MRILITGANGFIGSRLAALALEDGHEVRTLTRREWDGPPYVPLANRYFGRLPFDLPDAAFDGVGAVIHCAATAESEPLRARVVNVVGTRETAERAQRGGAGAFIFFSSQSARRDAAAPYGRTKFDAEEVIRSIEGIDVVILRAGLVIGGGGLFGRVVRMADRLPAIPVFGGGAVVQPIWVDDLARAALRCAREHTSLAGSILALGSPDGVALRELIEAIARGSPRPKRVIRVPDRPVAAAVALAEAVGLRPALSSTNLAGMRTARAMDTRSNMTRLGVPERSLEELVRLAFEPAAPKASEHRARRVLVVGAGRIGLVHAITLSRLPGAVLSGAVDRSPGALRLLRGIGIDSASTASLDDALEDGHDAAVIATPPASHLALVRKCADRDLRVFVEKPAAVGAADFAGYGELLDRRPAILVGYLLPGSPHVRAALERMKAGAFGRVLGFRAFTLLDFVRHGGPERWETRPEVAGGGVLANSATHLLSLIDAAFGTPRSLSAEVRRTVPGGVEDSAVVRFDYEDMSGSLFASWSFDGFDRQENRLVVVTDRGELTITTNAWQFVSEGKAVEFGHQLDHPAAFNLAPDYAGGGIAAELQNLVAADRDAAVTLTDALRIERQLYSIYDSAAEVTAFSPDGAPGEGPKSATPLRADEKLVLDLRGRSRTEVEAAIANPSPAAGRVEVDLRHLELARGNLDEREVRVMIPDFLRHVRRIGDRRYGDVLRELGALGSTRAAVIAARGVLRDRALGFWTAAASLVAGELEQVPHRFRGVVLLHPYLVDLAVALEQFDRLDD